MKEDWEDLQECVNALNKLIERIEAIVPYVTATLSSGSSVETSDPDWAAVHRGRAVSSCRQLEGLLKQAKAIK